MPGPLDLTEDDFREQLKSLSQSAREHADLITDDQFHMRLVDNAAAQEKLIKELHHAIANDAHWSALDAAVRLGIVVGLGQALPIEYHAVRRATEIAETIFVAHYIEDGALVEEFGVFTAVDLAKRACEKHFATFHPGKPDWVDEGGIARAEDRRGRGRYVVRKAELIDH